jgi:hypothetical protein
MALTKVTNTGIADDAVTTDKIEDGTVVAADIAPGTIANAKLANSSITLNGSSLSLGGSATVKHIDWQALTVADGSTTLNAEAGKGYFLDTNAGVIEVFLPSSPTRGDTVVLADYSGTFATNQIIINTGGELLDSTAGNDFKVTTNNSIVELVYVDAAKGWLVKLNQAAGTTPSSALDGGNVYNTDQKFVAATGGTVATSGDYKIHSFTGDGCFVVSCEGNPAGSTTVDYLVVAGGGGSGKYYGGGGGGGGYRESSGAASGCYSVSPLGACVSALPVSVTTYPITVGGGGATAPSPSPGQGTSGSNSVFSTITSTGGGYGNGGLTPAQPSGGPGGSGGGGQSPCSPSNVGGRTGGTGNTPPTSPPQGNPGVTTPAPAWAGAGGGATATGAIRVGGAGATSSINNTPTGRAGGGAGGPCSGTGSPQAGAAAASPCGSGAYYNTNATANTGGGGGSDGGVGGSGIVIIRYKFQ